MDEIISINRKIRALKYYFIAAVIFSIILIVSGFIQVGKIKKFRELTVEKINVVDDNGNIRVILAGNFPPRRTELAGLLFINQEGTEAGGLVYTGQMVDGVVSAGAALTMDQYNNDQIVVLRYDEENGQRKHGLTIADRPDKLSPEVLAAYSVLDTMAEGLRRDSIIHDLFSRIPPEELVARRLFVGRDVAKASVVELSDRKGNPRLRLSVDSLGNPAINFLDPDGKILKTIPDI
jgi:hypothetical protein